MSYSLLNRFRGLLLGGILGDAVTSLSPGHPQPDWYKILNYQPSDWQSQLQQVCLMINFPSPLRAKSWAV